ncbi:Fatty acid desaturase, type 2 [hydrothermal vent metagenome]|uniref:Fatty acid desaturase, type 2 n=1 Tax=hydrothermal vent metagenome TaxID=652676 RepID=A0A3B0SFA5_9ZZZZ
MTILRENGSFPMAEANRLVADLMKPDPKIYWTDFLISIALGWAGFTLALLYPWFSLAGMAGLVLAVFALYRAVLFTHELTHLKTGTFKTFRLVWNLLAGFAFLIPAFTYHGVHRHHHVHDVYGTKEDGEYLPFGAGNPAGIFGYMLLIFILPAFFVLRFMLLAPLSVILPPLRKLIWGSFSSLTIDLTYVRPMPSGKDPKASWYLQELLAFIYGWTAVALVWLGILPLKALLLWYGIAVIIFLLNSLRTLAAHAYRNPGEQQMSMVEQFLDSVDVPGHRLITTLWAPTGLRFHATHHLYPRMPYHNLPKAYQRLKAGLSDNSIYLTASRNSLADALVRLYKDAAKAEGERDDTPPILS